MVFSFLFALAMGLVTLALVAAPHPAKAPKPLVIPARKR